MQDDIVDRYLDGTLTPTERDDLARVLAEDPLVRDGFMADVRMAYAIGFIHQANDPQVVADLVDSHITGARSSRKLFLTTAVLGRISQRDRWRRRLAWAAAACLVVGLGLRWWSVSDHAAPGGLARIDVAADGASVIRQGHRMPVTTDMSLQSHDRIETVAGGLRLTFVDRSRIEVEPGTRLDLWDDAGAKRVRLERGEVRCEVAKQPAGTPMRLMTAQAEATVVGTRLRLSHVGTNTRLDVIEGRVDFHGLGDGVLAQVTAGRCAIAGQDVATAVRSRDASRDLVNEGAVPDYHARWPHGIRSDPSYFPLAVWLQDPANAKIYQRAGINLYIGLWQGPTERDLKTLAALGIGAIGEPNEVALRHLADPTMVGWLRTDHIHPDGNGPSYPPVDPAVVAERYAGIRATDASRPAYLFFGQGVVDDGFTGRGARARHPGDYQGYVQGADILGLQVFPVNTRSLAGDLASVARGVERLRAWSGDAKPVWCWIECTRIGADSPAAPTPAQVRAEVWLALIHGASGIGYFCHSWATGSEDDAALLHDPEMLAAVGAIDREVAALAAIINAPVAAGDLLIGSSAAAPPVDATLRRHDGRLYVFAANPRGVATVVTFAAPTAATVEVLGEGRSLHADAGAFTDRFQPYAVHLYAMPDFTHRSRP